MRGTLGATLEDVGHDSSLEVEIDYDATPGEPRVMYYPNGDGYPGSPPDVELIGVRVTRWDVWQDEERKRGDHWIWRELDRIAETVVYDNWDYSWRTWCLEDAAQRAEDHRY